MLASYFYVKSHQICCNLLMLEDISLCEFKLFLRVKIVVKKILNTGIVSQVKITGGVSVSFSGFSAIQKHISKRNMFRQLWIKVKEKGHLKLCSIETLTADDTVLDNLLRSKTKRHYRENNRVLDFHYML